MPYPKAMVQPMREELTRLGVDELRTAEAVDEAFAAAEDQTLLLVINSVCGCAASNARPAVAMASQAGGPQPAHYVTVFAGQDLEATERAREKLPGVPPSSPFLALFKKGQPVAIIERRDIEGRSAQAIASDLTSAFAEHCDDQAAGGGDKDLTEASERQEAASSDTSPSEAESGDGLPDTFRSIT